MSLPNLECVKLATVPIPAGSSVPITDSSSTEFSGLYMWNFIEDLESNATSINTVTGGSSTVQINPVSTPIFFNPQGILGNISTEVPVADSVTLVITSTHITLVNTRATASQVKLFVYKYA